MERIPSKTLIVGLQGVGKSSLASKMKRPFFFDLENGTRFLPVDKVRIHDYQDFVNQLGIFFRGQTKERTYDTVVIDSADWLLTMLNEAVAGSGGQSTAERVKNANKTVGGANGGYAKGYEHARNLLYTTLITLDKLIDAGFSVVLTAHAVKRELMDADGYAADQVSPKIDKKNADMVMEWVDHIFYLKADNKGKRWLLTSPTDDIVAKNRLGLTGWKDVDDLDIEAMLQPNFNKSNDN